MNQKLKGSLSLLLATMIWGSTFVAQSVGMDYIGPFTFQAVRCGLAAIGLLPVIFLFDKSAKTFVTGWQSKRLWKAGVLCGIPLFLACNLQQLGMVAGASAGKTSFITTLYVVLVPICGLFLKKKVPLSVWLGVMVAVQGIRKLWGKKADNA